MQELRELSAGFSADRLNGFRIKYPQGWSIQEANGKNFGSVGGPIATLIPPAVLGVGDEIHIGSIGQDKTCVSYSRCRYAPGYPWMWTSSKNPTVLAAFDQIATGATRSDGTSITYHDPSYVNELIPLSKSVGTPSIFTLFDVIYENHTRPQCHTFTAQPRQQDTPDIWPTLHQEKWEKQRHIRLTVCQCRRE
jgi:hypothetical protein